MGKHRRDAGPLMLPENQKLRGKRNELLIFAARRSIAEISNNGSLGTNGSLGPIPKK